MNADLRQIETQIHALIAGIIARQLQDFDDVRCIGDGLKQIRDGELWRDTGAASFGAYCQTEFGFSQSRAGQFIRASETGEKIRIQFVEAVERDIHLGEVEHLKHLFVERGLPLPKNERVLRELIRAPEEQRLPIWLTSLKVAGMAESNPRPRVTESIVRLTIQSMAEAHPSNHPLMQELAQAEYERKQDALLTKIKELYSLLDAGRKTLFKQSIKE